jgi:Protein of unknown function (DUF3309)
MNTTILLIIIVVILLAGGGYTYGNREAWGPYPLVGIILVILLVLILFGRLHL